MKMSERQIANWDRWVSLVSSQTGQPVKMIDLRRPAAIDIVSGNLDLHVGAADSMLERRLSRLASVMPVLPTLTGKLQFIDLSLDSNIPLKMAKATDKDGDSKLRLSNSLLGSPPQ
jgi:hypothetical protein